MLILIRVIHVIILSFVIMWSMVMSHFLSPPLSLLMANNCLLISSLVMRESLLSHLHSHSYSSDVRCVLSFLHNSFIIFPNIFSSYSTSVLPIASLQVIPNSTCGLLWPNQFIFFVRGSCSILAFSLYQFAYYFASR